MLSSGAEERDALVHLTLTGRTKMHDELRQQSTAVISWERGAAVHSVGVGRAAKRTPGGKRNYAECGAEY